LPGNSAVPGKTAAVPGRAFSKVDGLENVEILPWTTAAAVHSGAILAKLADAGKPIGAYDLQIAGHPRSLAATLVTHNRKEFSRVSDLRWEDWATP
jgi:tRNA(fMet)-specific endonuclease VapC